MIEVICLATIVFNEARGQPDIAQIAVAHVVMNNTHDPCTVKAPQFVTKPVIADTLNDVDLAAWSTALVIAYQVLNGHTDDPTDGARHFTTAYFVPEWAKSGMTVFPIHDLWFWKDRPYD